MSAVRGLPGDIRGITVITTVSGTRDSPGLSKGLRDMRSPLSAVVTLSSAAVLAASAVFAVAPGVSAVSASSQAPGAPGTASDWVTGDKDGFGTARGTASKVWYTLHGGELSEIYYPRIDTPSTRDTQLLISAGHTFTARASTHTIHRVRLLAPHSLTYQHVDL